MVLDLEFNRRMLKQNTNPRDGTAVAFLSESKADSTQVMFDWIATKYIVQLFHYFHVNLSDTWNQVMIV